MGAVNMIRMSEPERRTPGEVLLWRAVLVGALHDAHDVHKSCAGLRHTARYWLIEEKSDHVGSFSWVCSTLGLDVEKCRSIVQRTGLPDVPEDNELTILQEEAPSES